MDANSVTAFAASVTAGAFIVYTFVTWRLWQQTKRQAQTAERQAITAQQMLEAAYRPWLSRAAWEGKIWGESDPLVPKGNPANLCIFPGQQGELRWSIPNVSFAPWPKGGLLRLNLEITYRGAFEDRTYQTRVEASEPVPVGKLGGRRDTPMQIVKTETT
jgi:hypothetical protein